MTSRLQVPARMLLRQAPRVVSRIGSPQVALSVSSVEPRVFSSVQHFSSHGGDATSSSTSTGSKPLIQLQASANSADRPSLITAVTEAISASGGWLSQTKTNEACDVFVLEGVGSEQLAAFHSKLEALMMDWNQSTQQFLEDCYFSLVNKVQTNQPDCGTTAVLQLNWR